VCSSDLLVKKRTNLRYPDIELVFDLFIFFFKKNLLERGTLHFINFGELYLIKIKHGNVVRFRNTKNLKKVINNIISYKFSPNKNRRSDSREMLLTVSRVLSTPLKQATIILNLFILGIVNALLKDGKVKIRNFGCFYVKKIDFKKTNVCGMEKQIRAVNKVDFKPKLRFLMEANGKFDEIATYKRAENNLKSLNISKKFVLKNI
jgi:nucleoid DNA-binding protein